MTEFNLIEKVGEWFESLKSFRNTEIRQIYKKDKEQLDEIHKKFVEVVLDEINEFEDKQLFHCKDSPDGLCDECEVDYKRIKELKQKVTQKSGLELVEEEKKE